MSFYKETAGTQIYVIQWKIALSWFAKFRITAFALKLDILLKDRLWCGKCKFLDFFEFSTVTATRGHAYKLYKSCCTIAVFVVDILQKNCNNMWNFLPPSVNFSTLDTFKRSIVSVDFSSFMKCNYRLVHIRTFLGQLSVIPLSLLSCLFCSVARVIFPSFSK